MSINILESIDNPLLNQEKEISDLNKKINIKFRARNMKKGLTTIYGLSEMGYTDKDMNKMATIIKKKCGCASYVKEVDGLIVIEIQGDKTEESKNILMKEFNIEAKKINAL